MDFTVIVSSGLKGIVLTKKSGDKEIKLPKPQSQVCRYFVKHCGNSILEIGVLRTLSDAVTIISVYTIPALASLSTI